MKSMIEKVFSIKALLSLLLVFAASGAWAVAPTPTAVWDGNFSTTKVNGWTLSANGNTVAADKSTITITSKGLTVTPTTAVTAGTGVTVLVKMRGITQNDNNDQILVCAKQNNVAVKTGTAVCMGAMTMHGSWDGATRWSDNRNAETTFTVPASGEFYVVFTTGDSSSTVREGIYANGSINVTEISGLRDSAHTVQMIAIGGQPSSEGSRAYNAVISRVMIYSGCLTQQQMKEALDDMETTKSYSLQCQGSGNKGGLTWANFQLPYSTYYAVSGSASLNSAKALRQMTIPWRPDGTVNSGSAANVYIGITDSSNKLLALSSGADMSTVATTSSSTFDFDQTYLTEGTQYRYWFLASNSYSLGDTISSGTEMGCSLYGIGSAVTQMRSNTMDKYCPAVRFWVSNMTESEFTATAGGTVVSASGAYADDITLKGVADGKFTLGGALNAARITLADADVTIGMDSGDSIKAQYVDNSSQKLVIDASNGATAVGTYTLFEGTLASVADANLEVTFPTLGSGYELYTTKTVNKISYQVDRTAVNATLTLTADCIFSEVKDSIDWMDSNHSTLEIVNNQESPITLTFDENITAGSITVSGTGTTIIESSNSAVITAGTVTVPSGSTIDATGSSITTGTGAGTFIWKAGYPATVPAGATYQYVGSNDSANPTACDGVTVNGTLKTTGFISLTRFALESTGTYEVVSDTATVSARAAKAISGNITIDSGATYVNANRFGGDATDAVNYDQSGMVFTIRGTLSMGNTRWSLRGKTKHEIRLYDGAVISGAGEGSNGAFDWIDNETGGQIDTYSGNVTISAALRVRGGANVAFWVADNATATISGTVNGTGTFSKSGANGTLNLTGTIGNGKLTVNAGCVNVGSTMAVNIGCGNSAGYVTASDDVVVTGSISSDSKDKLGSSMQTFLQTAAKWQGTFVADWAGANGTQFDINSYGNANSVVEVTKLAGGYVSGSNANVTVDPTVKVSGTMTLDNGYSGKVTTFTKLTGSGTVTFNNYTCNITTLDNFTGTLTPTDTQGTTIGTINLTSTPAFGAKVVTLGTGANIRSIGSTSVSVGGVVDNTIALVLVANDGIYRAEAAYGGANYVTLAAAVSAAETASADPSAVTVYNSSATVPSGYAIVTAAGGAMTLRSAGNDELIYWAAGNSGDWSGEASNETHTFYTTEGGTSTTKYVDGDTVVIANDVQIWSKTAAHGAKFQIGTDTAQAEVHFTRSGENCDDYILNGSTIEIKSGSTLVAERYGDTEPPTQAYTQWNSYSSHNGSEINATTITGAGTFKVGGNTGGHGAAAAILSGATTIACPIALETGATLVVPTSCSVTTPKAAAAKKGISVVTDDETFARTYSVVDAAAAVVNGENVVNYATVQAAVDAVAYPGTIYNYVLAYQSASVTPASTLKIKEDEDVTVTVTCPFGDYQVSESEPVDGVVTYTLIEKATTYTWVGSSGAVWGGYNFNCWQYDNSGVLSTANRLPDSADTVVFNGDATVTLSDSTTVGGVEVGDGVVALTGSSKTLTSATGGIVLTDDGASITVDGVTLSPTPVSGVDLMYVKATTSEGTTTYALQSAGSVVDGVATITDATAEVTVPASATAIEAAPAVSSIKLEAGSEIKKSDITIKYNGTTDITGAFTVTVADNQVTIALNENGSVTISADTITVKPAVAASEPMTMPGATTAPSFNIKTIPGLYYVVRSGTDPSSLTAGSATQATTTTTGLAGPALGNAETVRYYQISVGRTAAEAQE